MSSDTSAERVATSRSVPLTSSGRTDSETTSLALSVKARSEIVTFGAPDELKVDENGVVGGGVHLAPKELHELVDSRGDDVVFFDGRNAFEAEIGRFRGCGSSGRRHHSGFRRRTRQWQIRPSQGQSRGHVLHRRECAVRCCLR